MENCNCNRKIPIKMPPHHRRAFYIGAQEHFSVSEVKNNSRLFTHPITCLLIFESSFILLLSDYRLVTLIHFARDCQVVIYFIFLIFVESDAQTCYFGEEEIIALCNFWFVVYGVYNLFLFVFIIYIYFDRVLHAARWCKISRTYVFGSSCYLHYTNISSCLKYFYSTAVELLCIVMSL